MGTIRRWHLAVLLAAAGCVTGLYFTIRPSSVAPEKAGPTPPEQVASRPSGTANSVYPYNRVVAVTIGINHYPELTGALDLRFAENDARGFGELLQSKYGYEVVPVLGPQATKARILQVLRDLGEALGPKDALIVYFAGHGQVVERPGQGEAGYLLPADARLDLNNRGDSVRWAEQALDMQYLSDMAERLPARHVLVITDACCSGFMTRRGALERWDLKAFLTQPSRTLVAASTRRQKSTEDPDAQHGDFTAALLEELRKENVASVLDVFVPVMRRVAAKTNGRMTPQMAQIGDGDGMFVFIPQSVPKEVIERDLDAVAQGLDPSAEGGLGPTVRRARAQAGQVTSYTEAVSLVDAENYRYADNAEDLRAEWEARFERFQRNALQGDIWAVVALHFCYANGLGTEKDPAQAYRWARQADRFSKPKGVGRYLLGRCYLNGLGVSVSGAAARDIARKLFQEAADAGFGLAIRAVAREKLKDRPDAAGVQQAYRLLEQARDAGVLAAEWDLAELHLKGLLGKGRDVGTAIPLLERCAERGDSFADWQLFRLYTERLPGNPERDLKKAEAYLRRAASAGNPLALYDLGREYAGDSREFGLPRDLPKAFSLFERGAAAGNALSLVASARCLAEGRGVPADHALAKARLDAAIAAGSVEADILQGGWYFHGTIYTKDLEKSLQCFKRAADKGSMIGHLQAGMMYYEGAGVQMRAVQEGAYMTFHEDLHRGFHHLVKAWGLGITNPEEKRRVQNILQKYGECLTGEYESPFPDGVPVRESEELKRLRQRNDPLHNRSCAVNVAMSWERDYPETYRDFCDKANIDPRSGRRIKAGGKKKN